MINATKKWIFLKISGALLVPLMLWFILHFIKIYDQDYLNFVSFFSNPLTKFLFSMFIVNAYFFSALRQFPVEQILYSNLSRVLHHTLCPMQLSLRNSLNLVLYYFCKNLFFLALYLTLQA